MAFFLVSHIGFPPCYFSCVKFVLLFFFFFKVAITGTEKFFTENQNEEKGRHDFTKGEAIIKKQT